MEKENLEAIGLQWMGSFATTQLCVIELIPCSGQDKWIVTLGSVNTAV